MAAPRRVRRAQYLLETTAHPVDRIARQVGFGSPTAFRDRFKRIVGTSPHAYRRAFRPRAASGRSGSLTGGRRYPALGKCRLQAGSRLGAGPVQASRHGGPSRWASLGR